MAAAPMTTPVLNKEGLEKAREARNAMWPADGLEAAIAAYLSHAAGDVSVADDLIEKYATACWAHDLQQMPRDVIRQHFREFANEVSAAISARAEAAEARVKEMEAALEPFAKLADELFRIEDGREMNASKRDDAGVWGFDRVTITYGDFRAARSLSPIKEAGNNG